MLVRASVYKPKVRQVTDLNVREIWLFRLDKIERREGRRYVRGKDDSAEFTPVDLGWFITCGNVTFAVERLNQHSASAIR